MQYPNLVFFTGRKRSGKDFCVEALAKADGVARLSFSDELRRVAHHIYPWLPVIIPDSMKDLPYPHPLNHKGLTPRDIWKHLGGDDGLRHVQPGLFLYHFKLNQLPHVVANPGRKFAVTDLRTPQEYEFALSTGCPIIRVSKPDRSGIVEDKIEDFIDQMEVSHEFTNQLDGEEAFLKFYRGINQ